MIKLDEETSKFLVTTGSYSGTKFMMDDFKFGEGSDENTLSYNLDIVNLQLDGQKIEITEDEKLLFNESVVVEFITDAITALAKGTNHE